MSHLSIIPFEGLDVTFDGMEPVMTQAQIAQLLGITRDAVSVALKRAEERGQIDLDSVSYNLSVTASDGKTYQVKHYNMEAIALVGFRVNEATPRVIAFRKWVASLISREIEALARERELAERERDEALHRSEQSQAERDEALHTLNDTARELRIVNELWEGERERTDDLLLRRLESYYPEEFDTDD